MKKFVLNLVFNSLLFVGFVPMPAAAQVKRYISLDSFCSRAVRIYISHADGVRNWHVHGPYNFAAYEGPTRLNNNGVTLTQTEGHEIYFFAESIDGSKQWQGSYNFEFNGISYPMQKATLSIVGGELRVKLSC